MWIYLGFSKQREQQDEGRDALLGLEHHHDPEPDRGSDKACQKAPRSQFPPAILLLPHGDGATAGKGAKVISGSSGYHAPSLPAVSDDKAGRATARGSQLKPDAGSRRPRSCFPPLAAHPQRAGGAPFLSRTLVSLRILRATTSRRPVPESNPNPRRYQRIRWGGHEWSGMPSAAPGHLRQKRQRSFLPGPFLAVEDRL